MRTYVYMLKCADDSYYTFHTDNLEKALAEHAEGLVPGYTRNRTPVKLVFSMAFPSLDAALTAERRIRARSRADKEAIVINHSRLLEGLSRSLPQDAL